METRIRTFNSKKMINVCGIQSNLDCDGNTCNSKNVSNKTALVLSIETHDMEIHTIETLEKKNVPFK